MIKLLLDEGKLVQGRQSYGPWTCIGWGDSNIGAWLIPCGHIVVSQGSSLIDCPTCKKFYEINFFI